MSIFDNLFLNPVRDAAQQTLGAGHDIGQWFQQAHPGLTGHLANVGYSLANMGPTSESAGDNISNVFRGIVGGRQEQFQQQAQRAMLPWQMAMPRLQAENLQSEINYRGQQGELDRSRMAYESAQSNRADAQAQWYANRVQQPTGADIAYNLAVKAAGVKDPNNLTSDEATKVSGVYNDIIHKQSVAGGGSFEEQSYDAARAKNPTLDPMQFHTQWAGAGAAGTGSVNHPFASTESFLSQEENQMKGGLAKIPTQEQWVSMMNNANPIAFIGKKPEEIQSMYDSATGPVQSKNIQQISQFQKYRANYKPVNGKNVSFFDWQTQQQGQQGPSSGGASSSFGANPYDTQTH